jgi:DNA-binding response OmpR family regulator
MSEMRLSTHDFDATTELPLDVLIVEDEPTARRALGTLLSACGYTTDAVSSAEDALKHVEEDGKPTVVLVDLDLPGMSGLELIERLKVVSPTTFPVLITAAAREAIDPIRPRSPLAYMQKPVDFQRLLTLINSRRHS